jgi:ArsR family transcriptional regulator
MASTHDMELYKMKADLCRTLADPKRLIIINELQSGELAVGKLAEKLDLQQAMVSRHLLVLRERGVVKSRREGTSVYYSLTNPKIGEACAMVHEILLNQLQQSKQFADKVIS